MEITSDRISFVRALGDGGTAWLQVEQWVSECFGLTVFKTSYPVLIVRIEND